MNEIKNSSSNSVIEKYSREQIDLIKSQVAPQATDDELKLFLYVANQKMLDPLSRQIYCIHRGGKMTIQTSIDGFRAIAERTGTYAPGSESWTDDSNGKPISATVSVKKLINGSWIEFSATAHTSEYSSGGNMWSKMAHVMSAKCAEAKALRKGWPEQLGGLYTSEEMAQSDNDRFAALTEEKPKLLEQKKSKQLPEIPDKIETIPDEFINAFPIIKSLMGVKMSDMTLEDLELLVDFSSNYREKVKTNEAKLWLLSIQSDATHRKSMLEASK